MWGNSCSDAIENCQQCLRTCARRLKTPVWLVSSWRSCLTNRGQTSESKSVHCVITALASGHYCPRLWHNPPPPADTKLVVLTTATKACFVVRVTITCISVSGYAARKIELEINTGTLIITCDFMKKEAPSSELRNIVSKTTTLIACHIKWLVVHLLLETFKHALMTFYIVVHVILN